jgi:nucleotide-binding universal stress UspA family protein
MGNVVLLAIDGSEGAERALDHALRRAQSAGSKVVVAYVIEWSPYSFNTPEENAERHARRESEIDRAQSGVVDPAVKRLKDAGIDTSSEVRHGSPAETLIDIANESAATQIVIGRRGQSGIKALLFGSVAGSLIQTAPVPVVVVP